MKHLPLLPNVAWAAILIVALAIMTIGSWYINRAGFLIVACHNLVWAGAILLIGTNLIAFKESSAGAWLTLACGLLFFNTGAWAARLVSSKPFMSQDEKALGVKSSRFLMSRRTLAIMLAIYAVAFGVYLANISVRFGLSTLFTDPISIRAFKEVSYLASVPLAIRVLLYLGPLLFVIFGYKAAMKNPLPLWLRAVSMILLAVSMLALLQRTNLFMGILWLLAVLITQPLQRGSRKSGSPTNSSNRDGPLTEGGDSLPEVRPRRVKVVLGVLGCLVVALVGFQGIAGVLQKTGQQALSTGAVSAPLANSGLTSPFTYYTAGVVAFLQLVDSGNYSWPPPRTDRQMTLGDYNPQTWGASTFAPILKAVPGARPWDSVAPFIDTAVTTNVYTWLEPYYRDFRLPGVIVAMFVLGLLITGLYERRARSPRIFWLQSAFFSTVFLATFVTKINNTLFLSELIFIGLLTIRWPAGNVGTWIRGRRATPDVQQLGAEAGKVDQE